MRKYFSKAVNVKQELSCLLLIYFVVVDKTIATAKFIEASDANPNIKRVFNNKNNINFDKGSERPKQDFTYSGDKNEQLLLLSQNDVDKHNRGEDLVSVVENKINYSYGHGDDVDPIEDNENFQSQDKHKNQRIFTSYAHKRKQQANNPSLLLSHRKQNYRTSENNKNNDINKRRKQASQLYNLNRKKNNNNNNNHFKGIENNNLGKELFSKSQQGEFNIPKFIILSPCYNISLCVLKSLLSMFSCELKFDYKNRNSYALCRCYTSKSQGQQTLDILNSNNYRKVYT